MPRKKKSDSDQEMTFEEAFERLTGVVDKLEAGEGTLTDRTHLFEEGVHLSQKCSEELDAIEKKVEILLDRDTTAEPTPFEGDEPVDE